MRALIIIITAFFAGLIQGVASLNEDDIKDISATLRFVIEIALVWLWVDWMVRA